LHDNVNVRIRQSAVHRMLLYYFTTKDGTDQILIQRTYIQQMHSKCNTTMDSTNIAHLHHVGKQHFIYYKLINFH